jgi:hypothetical protein
MGLFGIDDLEKIEIGEREKESRNRQFLLFGLAEKLRRGKKNCGTHCFFHSLHPCEETQQTVLFSFFSHFYPSFLGPLVVVFSI